MIRLASKELCSGCNACCNACRHNAIKMVSDAEGFLCPTIDCAKCVECHLCERSCPALQAEESVNAVTPKAYAVWSNADRCISSSGGAFSAFARFVLKQGGVVYGAAFDDNLNCRHIEIESVEGLKNLRGSKYVQSQIGDTFRKIKDRLREEKYVLFCGTPCQVAGLKSYLRKDYERLLALDLACHGVPSQQVFHAYIAKISTRFAGNGEIDGFEFRRRDRWGKAPSVSLGGKLRPIYGEDNLYMNAFDKSALFRQSCYSCKYATLPRVGDCTIADFWGIGRHGTPFGHSTLKGVSLVLVNNDKGRRWLEQLDRKDVFMEERTLDEALIENHNLTKPSQRHPDREAIIQSFLNPNMELKDIEHRFHLVDKSLKGKIKELASKYQVYDIVKNIYNKVVSMRVLTKVNGGGNALSLTRELSTEVSSRRKPHNTLWIWKRQFR